MNKHEFSNGGNGERLIALLILSTITIALTITGICYLLKLP